MSEMFIVWLIDYTLVNTFVENKSYKGGDREK